MYLCFRNFVVMNFPTMKKRIILWGLFNRNDLPNPDFSQWKTWLFLEKIYAVAIKLIQSRSQGKQLEKIELTSRFILKLYCRKRGRYENDATRKGLLKYQIQETKSFNLKWFNLLTPLVLLKPVPESWTMPTNLVTFLLKCPHFLITVALTWTLIHFMQDKHCWLHEKKFV